MREMSLEDIPQAVFIEKECFSQPWSAKSFEDSLGRTDTVFLVCEEDGMVVGYIGMYISFEEADITNVAVLPAYRKRGCGRTLVLAAIAFAKKKQAEKIFLEVRVSNLPAISLYETLGFHNIGIRKNFYEYPHEDAYIMQIYLEAVETCGTSLFFGMGDLS